MYCGCKTCCGKTTWCLSVLLLLAAAAGLAAGLYVTVPCARTLSQCYRSPAAGTSADQCWTQFWQCTKSGKAGGLFFFLACAGAGCFILSLLTCCCFCCQKGPGSKASKKAKKQEQFMTGTATTEAPTQAAAPTADTAAYSDQYAAYSGYPNVNKPSVAHV